MDPAAVEPHDLVCYGQPQTDAFEVLGVGVLLLLKGLEDALERVGRDTTARVRDEHLHPPASGVLLRRDRDVALHRELAGVRDDVVEDLSAPVSIRLDDGQGLHFGAQVDPWLHERVADLVHGALHEGDDLLDDNRQLHGVALELQSLPPPCAVLLRQARHLHDVHDQVEEPGRATPDQLEQPHLGCIRFVVDKTLREANDAVQGASKLMRHNSHEARLPGLGLLEGLHLGQVAAHECNSLHVSGPVA
mmetsp:Transcript_88309/g.276525  ORF Transcript_88309/g.276525 Transcript_88309/m.276525 type:complete len:248 (+) Transcript_88309:730-1473(+)